MLFVFVTMGPHGSENFKALLLLQSAAKGFQTSPEFSFQWSSQNYVWDVFKLRYRVFTTCFFENVKFTIVAA